MISCFEIKMNNHYLQEESMRKLLSITLASVMALSIVACGNTQEATTTAAATTAAATTAAASEAATDETEAAASEADAVVEAAIENTKKRTGEQTVWDGPTSGPKAATGKKIAIVNANAESGAEKKWGDYTEEAAKRIGWETVTLDGKGTVQGQLDAINQAIAMKVDGIYTSADAASLQSGMDAAKEAGIPVVGVHAAGNPGPDEEIGLFYNCSSGPEDIGTAMAEYALADSNGTARVIILYDSNYEIARRKTSAMQETIESCPTATLLEVVNSPMSEIPTQVPQLMTSWVSKYGSEPFYVLCISDAYYDFAASTLRSGGVATDQVRLIGSDGVEAAYDRIRNREYQIGTVPEPGALFGYCVIDEFNRAFNGEEAYTYKPSIYIVTPDNVDAEGGDQGLYIPSNNFADHYAEIWGVE